ncbi:MAG: hypothetical protein M0Q92_02675 [Methanoregula sp.]|jgi:hypothetical protein|nr:hypothetical protein [Methanoregula sp.]
MKTLFDYSQPDPQQEHSVPVGPVPIRNWPLALSTARECLGRYGHALPVSNGSEDRPASGEWNGR